MVKTVAEPQFTEAGRDVLAFHLHRYLAHWLAKSGIDRVFVIVGWEHAAIDAVTIEVGRLQTNTASVGWDFARLCEAHHKSGARLAVEIDDQLLHALTITEPDVYDRPQVFAFVLFETELEDALRHELEVHAGEAIRAARRNSVRLLFDECDDTDMKAVLYDVLDHLPEWTGCDVAAACVLANSLEAMSLDQAAEADFYVMAERLYDTDDPNATRLVGLAIDTRDDIRTVVDAAIERLARDASPQLVRFRRTAQDYLDDQDQPAVSIGAVSGRTQDHLNLVVPIVADRHEVELIGYLCLAFRRADQLPRSVEELLRQLGSELGHLLRHSPLYSLSASRLRLVREVRRACEAEVARAGAPGERRDAIVSRVAALVEQATAVPAFSVGYVVGEPRTLRYTASYGWADFDTIDLVVDVPDGEHADSGVSALAVRLNRSVVLAGGRREGDQQEFKNFLWVHEASGRIVDTRAPGEDVEGAPGWTRLGLYYKPARRDAYATIAYPVTFDGRALGVVALEVDRDTEWTWWATYSGQLLWELVASELAFAFWVLDRELHG